MALSPETIKTIGFWVLVAGLLGDILVLFMPSGRRRLEKTLGVLFTLVVIFGVAIEKIGDNIVTQRNGPRHISSRTITESVKQYAGQEFTMFQYSNDREVSDLFGEIRAALDAAGWKYVEPNLGNRYVGGIMGVLVIVNSASDDAVPAAAALVNSLNREFIATQAEPESDQAAKVIAIHVGTRVRWD